MFNRYFTISMCSLAIYCFFIYFVRNSVAREKKVSYKGAQVWRTNLRSSRDVDIIKKLENDKVISLWTLNREVVDYMIHTKKKKKLKKVLKRQGLNHTTIIEDLQNTLESLEEPLPTWDENALRIGHRLTWKRYPRLNIINEYLVYLTKTYPRLIRISTIGLSHENRPIKMVRIFGGLPKNKIIMVTAGIHAREWISVTSSLYLITTLVTKYENLQKHMRDIDWRIIPVMNPDGYEYSHTTDRLWRKNRRIFRGICEGVDLNRNFDFHWYIPGLTQNCCKCSDAYPGARSFSEPESSAVRDYIESMRKLPDAFVDLHSYGQLVVYPWAWTSRKPRTSDRLNDVAAKMSQAIKDNTRKNYLYGTTYDTIYPASGIQMDWFHSIGTKLSYTIELRDSVFGENNNHMYRNWMSMGFLLPTSQIEATGIDVAAAMTKLAEEVVGPSKNIRMQSVVKKLNIDVGIDIVVTID